MAFFIGMMVGGTVGVVVMALIIGGGGDEH